MVSPAAVAGRLAKVLAYRRDLRDAVTNEPVNDETILVKLHQPDALIQNLTGIATPAAAVQLFVENAGDFSSSAVLVGGHDSYSIESTFNKLMVAPTYRFDFKLAKVSAPSEKIPLSLEFHFNSVDNRIEAISGFKTINIDGAPGLEMTTYGATCEGLTNALNQAHDLDEHSLKLLAVICDLYKPKEAKRVRVRFPAGTGCLAELLPYVLSGQESTLPSMSAPEWASFMPFNIEQTAYESIWADVPQPMVPLASSDTFSSTTEAMVEHYESARMSFLEQSLGLQEWVKVEHKCALYRVGHTMVMIMRFSEFNKLGGAGAMSFRLPDRLRVKLTWIDPITRMPISVTALRTCIPLNLPNYDAAFVLDEQLSQELREASCTPDLDAGFKLNVAVSAKMSEAGYEYQTATAADLSHTDIDPFRPFLLNQDLRSLKIVDLAKTTVGGARVTEKDACIERAYLAMLHWRVWNPEQLQALRSIRKSVGGIIGIVGPGGAGKTLVQQAICVFLFRCGYHILALAPGNSNCADFCKKLTELFPDVPATRVFPPSTEVRLRSLNQTKTEETEPVADAEEDATMSNIFEFDMVRADMSSQSDKYSSFREMGLQARTIEAARAGEHTLMAYPRGKSAAVRGVKIDMWARLKECLEANDAGTFNWGDRTAMMAYQQAYDMCKAHLVTLTRLIVTTTGNVRCEDIFNNWAQDAHGVKVRGVVIVLDEACKDNEIDTMSALFCPSFRKKVVGMVMLGDEKQLEPTNISAKGKVQFNAFSERINIPFLSRLKRQGFRCTELLEQHRMSAHISYFPFREFYPAGMRNAASTFATLQQNFPGLRLCLEAILDLNTANFNALRSSTDQDRYLRTRYLQVSGNRDNSKLSAVVKEHILVWVDTVFWQLRAYFGNTMNKNVMIIVAYKQAHHCWRDALMALQRKYQLTNASLPRIVTIDSSQGTEAMVTFVDCSVQQYRPESRKKDIGFVDDDKRINVSMTRAREVRWFIGGDCGIGKRRINQPDTPAYIRYREETEYREELTVAGNELASLDMGWADALVEKPATHAGRFAKDLARMQGH